MVVEARAMRTRRTRKTTTWDDLEHVEEVFIEILSRLPLRAIRNVRRVNKYWYRSITNRFFAKKQLSLSRDKPSYITCPDMGLHPMLLYTMNQGSFRKSRLITIDPPEIEQGKSMYMIASFNGLVCCVNERHVAADDYFDLQVWIVNPCTGETLLLPQGTPSFTLEPSIGVAYGSTGYKVFRIFCAGEEVYECEVYSSVTGVWKNIGSAPCLPMSHLSPFRCGHVFVGGRVYWLSSIDDIDRASILCVDVEGRFEVLQFPSYEGAQREEDGITEGSYLFTLQGRLALVVLHLYDMDVWMLKGSGENGSWVLVCNGTPPLPYSSTDMVLAMTAIKNQIICMTEEKWCSYNMATEKWKRGRSNHAGLVDYPTVYPFTESYLPCNGML